VSAARLTAQSWRLDNVELVSRHAERALPGLPALEAIIVDPPRSGLGETVTAAIAANGAQLVLYLSCAPASMARDLATLESAGYRALTLEVFDFYPQTYHIETLAVLERSQ
jgi:23S rRNA (uracil1939-C5)-methyltransferase